MHTHPLRRSRAVIEALESRQLLSATIEPEIAPTTTPALTVAATAAHQPSVLHTQADFDRMATKVAAGEQPWLAGWNALTADGYAQLGANPRPLETVIRGGTGQNFAQMWIDIARTYECALRWKVSGDTRYADQAVRFLNAWSSTMTTLTGNSDRFLASGLYGYTWAVAADIMRSYEGWAAEDVTRFQNYLVGIYYPMQHDFLTNHNGAYITNYWANWDLANIEGMMAIGIFADRQDLYDEAMRYLYNGGGNGALDKIVYYMHPGRMAQWQESGRDQGHTLLGMMLFGHIAQMAWNQGDDLFSYNNHQFLAAAEYIAKYNAGSDVPFEEYYWGNGQSGAWSSQMVLGSGSRGNLTLGYELIYAHYVNRLGMAAPYTTQRVMQLRSEGRVGNGDGFGFGTLTFALDPYIGVQQPRGLTAAERGAGNIRLDWFGSSAATSYNVYRSTSSNGTYTQIASGITDLLTYTDTGLVGGTYYYKVTASTPAGETAASNVVSATASNQLHTLLTFNNTTTDATGNGHDGTLLNGPTWSSGVYGGAISLDGVDDYVQLPGGFVNDVTDFTIATWVNLNSAATWSRVFDFGDSRGRWMFLTPRNGAGKVEFATSTTYGYNKQAVASTAALPTNQWVHVAVTLSDRTATLYVNGVAVGANSGMDFPPMQIGSTSRNWIGRSQFTTDPYLNGLVDDFGIYRGALTAEQVAQLVAGTRPPVAPTIAANATATSLTNKTVRLSALGADDVDESGLTYTWTTVGTPPAPVTFDVNGSNVAKNSVAIFAKAGSYRFQVTITDAGGLSVRDFVDVVVDQSLTSIVVSPGTALVQQGGSAQFTAAGLDQFGIAMATTPATAWSVASGGGTISTSGLYTAPATTGSVIVRAVSGSVAGTAGVTITSAAPTNLVATSLSSSQIRLTWQDNATNETGYRIERANASGGPWTQIYSGATANLTSYMVTGLAANTRYYFRVRAYSTAGGNSAYSTVVNARTKASPVTYQAESATLAGGAKRASNYTGFTGTAFVDFPSNNGSVTWSNVSAAVAASHTLTFRYALGAGSARTVALKVNGVPLSGGVRFAPTAGWRIWANVTVTVSLLAGTNNIQLVSNGEDSGNVDSMTVTEI